MEFKHGLIKLRDIITPEAKKDGIRKYCKRDYNEFHFISSIKIVYVAGIGVQLGF